MGFRIAPLVLPNILFGIAILAVGLPGMLADALRLPSEVTIGQLRLGQPVGKADDIAAATRLEHALVFSNAARADLALALLADPADRVASDHAARQLRAYLATAPDDSMGWANLALGELRRGTGGAAVIPYKMSIELAPMSAASLAWRCGFGLDLFPYLDDDGKAMLARQFQMAMDDTLDGSIPEQVARLVKQRDVLPLVKTFFTDDPDGFHRLKSLIARRD